MLKSLKILLHREKDTFLKIGQGIFYIVLAMWLMWHLVSLQQSIVNPVKLDGKPVGYYLKEGNCYRQISYVRVKNRSMKDKHIRLALSAFDTAGTEWKYEIYKVEPWNLNIVQNLEINEDKTIVIPGKSEIGLYLEADLNAEERIYFPNFVEQRIQINILK